jgi:hypothetical protein
MPHQRDALRYSCRVDHPALFMEMRLGKTLPTIRRLLMYQPRRCSSRFLIVAPNSALGSWERELLCEGEDDVVFLQGTRAERLELLGSGARWNLINREGWRALPEIGNRRYCDECAGRGTRRRPTGSTVVNMKTDEYDVCIDRSSRWGNPFPIGRRHSRSSAIKAHKNWIKTQPQLLEALLEIVNKRLGCHCKPLACHGDTLLSMLRDLMPTELCPGCGGVGHTAMSPNYFWDAVVLDESTFVKNPKAQVTRFFLGNFGDVPHRWALTGTPNPEGPLDMWCQLAWLNDRAFGCKSYWQFRARHFEPDPWGYNWVPKPGVVLKIRQELARDAFCLRRADAGMTVKKIYERREVELPGELREAYEDADKLFLLEYDGLEVKRTIWATTRWHWMRQLCAGFVDGELVWPGKIDELVSLIRGELARQQVVVWFAYNAELRAVLKALRRARVHAEVMLGQTKPEQRRKLEYDFRRGWFPVFLIQEAIAETGLDLSTADAAVYFSNNPGLMARAQSEDRIVHPKKTAPLLYVDLVVKDSVEEVIAEQLTFKKWRSQLMFERAVMDRLRERRSA